MFLFLISFSQQNQNFQNSQQKPFPPPKRTSCPGPGTFVNGTGGCECSAETPFGDPESAVGCWSCNPQCDLNAQCVGPNKCICNEGYIGDGIDFCEKPVPILKRISPKEGPADGGTPIELSISVNATNYTVTKAFCRFGPIIVNAVQMNSSLIKCITTKEKPGNVQVSVGFDAIRWSNQQFTYVFQQNSTPPNEVFFYCFLALTVILLISISAWYYTKQSKFGENQDEILPLNKWHMNAPRINPQTEKTWMDFVWNIALD